MAKELEPRARAAMELLRAKSPTKLYTVYLCALDPWFVPYSADVRRIARGQVWKAHEPIIARMERVLSA